MTELDALERAPLLLFEAAEGLTPAAVIHKPPTGFAFVEQVWHLADLEREGYGLRLLRLLTEDRPTLPDFEGDRIARERRYLERSLEAGLLAFARARAANLLVLGSAPAEAWTRAGQQEGIGAVTLADIPRMMREHDRGHFAELVDLLPHIAPSHPALARLQREATPSASTSVRAA